MLTHAVPHTATSHLAEEAPGAYRQVSNLAGMQGHQGLSLQEKPSRTDWEAEGSHGPASKADLDTVRLLPGRWLSKDVNQAMGKKCCLDFRRDQGEMETWVSDSTYRGCLESLHQRRWPRETVQSRKEMEFKEHHHLEVEETERTSEGD